MTSKADSPGPNDHSSSSDIEDDGFVVVPWPQNVGLIYEEEKFEMVDWPEEADVPSFTLEDVPIPAAVKENTGQTRDAVILCATVPAFTAPGATVPDATAPVVTAPVTTKDDKTKEEAGELSTAQSVGAKPTIEAADQPRSTEESERKPTEPVPKHQNQMSKTSGKTHEDEGQAERKSNGMKAKTAQDLKPSAQENGKDEKESQHNGSVGKEIDMKISISQEAKENGSSVDQPREDKQQASPNGQGIEESTKDSPGNRICIEDFEYVDQSDRPYWYGLPKDLQPSEENYKMYPQFGGRRVLEGRFVVNSLMGKGGSGIVVTAYDLKRRLITALKMRHRSSEKNIIERWQTNFRTECRIHQVFSGLPFVIRVMDVVIMAARNELLMSMEHCHMNLKTAMERRFYCATPRQIKSVMHGITSALRMIHAQNYVHRDVKPTNIMLTEVGVPKLGDFGVCCQAGLHVDDTGTYAYQPPEVLLGHSLVSPNLDSWGLGLTFYQLVFDEFLYGKIRLQEDVLKAIQATLGPIHTRVPDFFQMPKRELLPEMGERKFELGFEHYVTHSADPDAGDLIAKLLNIDWTVRVTPAMCLAHHRYFADMPNF